MSRDCAAPPLEVHITRAWVSAWVIHNKHPQLAEEAARTLDVINPIHVAYREAILSHLDAAYERRFSLEGFV